MKKFLAIGLAFVMFTTMLAFSAGAVKEVGGENGVGSDEFTSTTTDGKDLNIQVTEVTHKYAVDVTFNLSDLTIDGNITWNVNDMKYDVDGASLTKTEQHITVSNRSDLPVYAYADISNAVDDDGISVTADKNSATNKLTVDKAIAGTGGTNGTATTGDITITIDSADWNAVAEYYVAKKLAEGGDSFKIATVSVIISKD